MISSASDDDPKLPKDVAVEVLKRLPVESLLRFRCVCRSWRSTIDDPRFVALHLNHSALDASNWHLVALHGDYPVRNLCYLLSGESLAPPSVSQIEIPFAATSSNNYGFVVGSCNDLICVMEYGHGNPWSMYLWNLFTRKYREVRPSTLARKYLCTIALGFGFDARSNDHKIVILYDGNVQRLETRVQIYSLRTDSWRSLECEVPAFCRNTSSVFLNGNLHWLVPKHDDMWWETGYRSIALFDVVNEVFDEMVPSEKFLHVISVSSQAVLSVLNDLLAVCTSREETVGHPETLLCFSVWVMREYGVPDSWTELYCFQTSEQVLGVDGFTRNGDLLLKIDGAKRLSRNPITGQFTNLPLRTHRDFYTVVESLVSP